MENVEASSTHHHLRVSFRATLAGVIVTLASMYFWMSFAAVMGFWSFRFEEIPTLGGGFWSIAAFSWVISVAMGTFTTVLSTHARSHLDGLIQALVTWSGAYLLFGGLLVSVVEATIGAVLFTSPESLMRIGFLGDALSLGTAFLCSYSAVQYQRSKDRAGEKKTTVVRKRSFSLPLRTSEPLTTRS